MDSPIHPQGTKASKWKGKGISKASEGGNVSKKNLTHSNMLQQGNYLSWRILRVCSKEISAKRTSDCAKDKGNGDQGK